MASKSSRADRRKFSGESKVFHNDAANASRAEVIRAQKASVSYTYMRGANIVKCSPDGAEEVVKHTEIEHSFDLRTELSL